MGDSLPWTPTNRRLKFDAASFVIGGDIRNRTNKHTNSNRYIHTLSCVDNNNTVITVNSDIVIIEDAMIGCVCRDTRDGRQWEDAGCSRRH